MMNTNLGPAELAWIASAVWALSLADRQQQQAALARAAQQYTRSTNPRKGK